MAIDTGKVRSRLAAWMVASSVFVIGCASQQVGCGTSPFENAQRCPPGTYAVNQMCKRIVTDTPNNYTCECSCPKPFAVGVRARTTADVFPESAPGGSPAGNQQSQASAGTVIGGPGHPPNAIENWWQVDFDAGTDGWVSEAELAVTDALLFADLDVCVPPSLNPNLSSGRIPSAQEIQDDCSIRVASRFQQVTGQDVPTACSCASLDTPATHAPAPWDASCDSHCADPSGVCVLAAHTEGSAFAARAVLDAPAAQPLPAAIFDATSICEVSGTLTIDVGGHTPDPQPATRGVVQIRGKRCPPGQTCQVGVAFQLDADDMTFDSGSIFVDDPTFRDLTLSGASTPDAVTLGPFLGGCCLGPVAAGSAVGSVRGRRSGTTDALLAVVTNPQAAGVIVDWAHKQCTLAGTFTGGEISNGDNGDASANVDVYITGTLVNQPPVADASATGLTVECTSPQGAAVMLDASRSSDPDGNIALYGWRRDSATGPYVSPPSGNPALTTRQALGPTTYALRVVDGRFAADVTTVGVSVVDTTKPVIACNAPSTITPDSVPEKGGISFKATATDVCSGVSGVAIAGYTCTKPASCRVRIQGDTITILDSGGVGDTISWTVSAGDAAGNGGQKTCQLNVVKKK
jgi:hypothetical protein